MTLTFQLPVPSRLLSPNTRAHWTRKASAIRTARTLAKHEARRVLEGSDAPQWEKASYKATLFHCGARTPDPDNFNASLKAYLDGIADAGVIANDRGLWPERPEYRRTDKMPRVEITIAPEYD